MNGFRSTKVLGSEVAICTRMQRALATPALWAGAVPRPKLICSRRLAASISRSQPCRSHGWSR